MFVISAKGKRGSERVRPCRVIFLLIRPFEKVAKYSSGTRKIAKTPLSMVPQSCGNASLKSPSTICDDAMSADNLTHMGDYIFNW